MKMYYYDLRPLYRVTMNIVDQGGDASATRLSREGLMAK